MQEKEGEKERERESQPCASKVRWHERSMQAAAEDMCGTTTSSPLTAEWSALIKGRFQKPASLLARLRQRLRARERERVARMGTARTA